MQPFIIISDGMDLVLFEELQGQENFNIHERSIVRRSELLKIIPEASCLVVRSQTIVDRELLDRATKLKYIIRAGEGTDHIDKNICHLRRIKISNTPAANSNAVAEQSISLMFALLRKTAWAHTNMVAGGWNKSAYIGNELAGKRLGILGFGKAGKLLAHRLVGFDMDIKYFDPYIARTETPPVSVNSLEDLFCTSDIISVHLPLVKATHNLIDGSLLDRMPSNALFINTSRGEILLEDDLILRLQKKTIGGAALDVYRQEPLSRNSPLRVLDNVILTPHLGASTEEARRRIGRMVIHQLQEFFLNNNLLNEVSSS